MYIIFGFQSANVHDKRVARTSESRAFQHNTHLPPLQQIPPQPTMENPSKEARILLALQAIKNNYKLSIAAAGRHYNVPPSTLRDRRNGKPARRDTLANSRKLTDLEE